MFLLFSPREAGASFLAINAMIGHVSTIIGSLLGGWIATNYGIRSCFIAGAIISSFLLLPIWWITDPRWDPVTKKLAAQAELASKAAELGLDPGDFSSPKTAHGPAAVVVSNPVSSADKLSALAASLRDSRASESSQGVEGDSPLNDDSEEARAFAGRRAAVVAAEMAKLSLLHQARETSLVSPQRGTMLPPPPLPGKGVPFLPSFAGTAPVAPDERQTLLEAASHVAEPPSGPAATCATPPPPPPPAIVHVGDRPG